jgi:hypothetical protein
MTSVSLPMVRPSILYACVLLFFLGLEVFGLMLDALPFMVTKRLAVRINRRCNITSGMVMQINTTATRYWVWRYGPLFPIGALAFHYGMSCRWRLSATSGSSRICCGRSSTRWRSGLSAD